MASPASPSPSSSGGPAPASRWILLVVGLALGALGVVGLNALRDPDREGQPAPSAAQPAGAPPRGVTRAPQLHEGTFTVWDYALNVIVAVASKHSNGTEVWLMNPTFVAPSSSDPEVSWKLKYESAAMPTTPAQLFQWVCGRPDVRPAFHGLNVKGVVHTTTIVWDGSVPRACN